MGRNDGEAREDSFFSWPDNPNCVGCRHYRAIHDHVPPGQTANICHYLLDTGHSRGCPFGEHCTKKTPQTSGTALTADHSGERDNP